MFDRTCAEMVEDLREMLNVPVVFRIMLRDGLVGKIGVIVSGTPYATALLGLGTTDEDAFDDAVARHGLSYQRDAAGRWV